MALVIAASVTTRLDVDPQVLLFGAGSLLALIAALLAIQLARVTTDSPPRARPISAREKEHQSGDRVNHP
jgi:hypothetical protein